MTKDQIRERVEKLVGMPAASTLHRIATDTTEMKWLHWRDQLIDRLAKDAKVLGGDYADAQIWHVGAGETHTCIALDFQPIHKPVTKSEIVEMLRAHKNHVQGSPQYPMKLDHLADRIEAHGVKDE